MRFIRGYRKKSEEIYCGKTANRGQVAQCGATTRQLGPSGAKWYRLAPHFRG